MCAQTQYEGGRNTQTVRAGAVVLARGVGMLQQHSSTMGRSVTAVMLSAFRLCFCSLQYIL